MSKEYLLLNNLDQPLKILFFSKNEFLVIFALIAIGFLFNQIWLVVLTLIMTPVYIMFLKKYFKKNVKEYLYLNIGFGTKSIKYKCPSHMKRMIG